MNDKELLDYLEDLGSFDAVYNEWQGWSVDDGPYAESLREAIEKRRDEA